VAVEVIADVSCGALDRVRRPLEPNVVHRFLVGSDPGPVALDGEAAAALLGDPVATLLLLEGRFPHTGAQLVDGLRDAAGAGDPLATHTTFALAEGGNIVFSPATAAVDRGLRFLVACGAEGRQDVIVSAAGPDDAFVEVMAWDRAAGGFNYYRTVKGAWVFAGNSRHALVAPTDGKGPFESHVNGNLIMKELRRPWIHWHSVLGLILDTALAPDDPRLRHPWFSEKRGADVFETTVARPAIRRWTKARFEQRAEPPARILRQILETATVNLICSPTESRLAQSAGDPVRLPQTFFVDSEVLTEVLDLPAPPAVLVDGATYAASLQRFGFELHSGDFRRAGDTRFAFVVPERAFEDRVALEAALAAGIVTKRLAACLLMVDFANPVFSPRRAALLAHAADAVDAEFAAATAGAILAAADGTPEGSAEREFAARWATGGDWPARFGALLQGYYDALRPRAATQAGFDDFTRLAESRRRLVRAMPIFENRLLFAETNMADERLGMRPDGTVVTVEVS
jgi:hypothetical protein